jgi:hypothetical protein
MTPAAPRAAGPDTPPGRAFSPVPGDLVVPTGQIQAYSFGERIAPPGIVTQ